MNDGMLEIVGISGAFHMVSESCDCHVIIM